MCVCVCVCVVDEIEVGYRKRDGTAFQTVNGLDRSTLFSTAQYVARGGI